MLQYAPKVDKQRKLAFGLIRASKSCRIARDQNCYDCVAKGASSIVRRRVFAALGMLSSRIFENPMSNPERNFASMP